MEINWEISVFILLLMVLLILLNKLSIMASRRTYEFPGCLITTPYHLWAWLRNMLCSIELTIHKFILHFITKYLHLSCLCSYTSIALILLLLLLLIIKRWLILKICNWFTVSHVWIITVTALTIRHSYITTAYISWSHTRG